MQLATVLLISLFLLCCTHNMDGLLSRFRFQPGRIAALAVLLMALSAFDFELGAGISLHPASMITLLLAAFASRREKEAYSLPLAAFGAGVMGWLIGMAVPGALEPGALVALPAALMARLLYKRLRAGLCMIMLAPLFHALIKMLEDWYLFGFASLSLGSALQLDAQLCGAAFYGLLLLIPELPRRISAQKAR